MKPLLLSAVLLLLLARPASALAATNDTPTLEIFNSIGRYSRWKNPTVVLLAQVSREDDRPWFVENALLLVQSGDRWAIAHAVRNPRYPDPKKPAGKWHHHHVMDAPWAGDAIFDHRPTREEVEKFLVRTGWQWHSEPNRFQVTKRFVDDAAWEKHLGFPPPVSSKDQRGIKQQLL